MANYLDNIKNRKTALADAMADTTVGVKAKPKATATPTPEPTADSGKPTKYNTPRNKGESLDDYATRLDSLKKAAR